jgi:AcrR family transcriptional regulator
MAGKRGSGRVADGRDDHVSRQEIVEAALAIIDEDGIDGLTMRRLAAAVGLQAPSLYHHFPSKAAVVADVLDLVWDEATARVPFDDVTDLVEATFASLMSLRRSFLDHPHMASFIGVIPRPGERMISSIEGLRGLVALLGFPSDPRAFDIIRTFVMGAIVLGATQETASAYLERDKQEALDWLEANDPDGPGRRHDERRAYLEIMSSPPSDENVEWGLRRLMEGLRES